MLLFLFFNYWFILFNSCSCRFPVKLICCIDLNILLSSYNVFLNKNNIVNHQMCNHIIEMNVVIYSHIIFNWLIQNVFSINYNIVLFYFYFWKKILSVCFSVIIFSDDKTKPNLLLKTVGLFRNLNMGFVSVLLFLIRIYSR